MKSINIYSLSTVGIRQHFNQDYLLHEDRTDFTGSNGSGKSIIADLLQIIFVANKRYIKFGTDGKDRNFDTIPYHNQNEAYSFLNITIEENQYVVIGVCISSKKGVPLKPFTITANTNLDLKIKDNTFYTPLCFKDFLDASGRVQNLKELAKHLNKEKGLKLTSFVHAENIDKYYAFLYHKEILPINLCNENSLRSFATVIQSFSRATNLRLKSSKDLKDFLFESEKENLIGEYNQHKTDLLKLMKDFRKLKEKMDSLDNKQRALKNLKEKNDLYEQVCLNQSRMEVLFHQHNWKEADKNRTTLEKKLTTLRNKKETFERDIKRLQLLVESTKKKKALIDVKSDQLLKLIELENELMPIIEKVKFWKEIQFPSVAEEDETLLSNYEALSNISHDKLKEIFRSSTELLNIYGSYKKVEKKRQQQKRTLEILKNELQSELKRKKGLLNILHNADENSLLNKILTSGKELSSKQEIVFMSLLELSLNQPTNPKNGTRYINNSNVLNDEFIVKDFNNDGVWLNLGRISEFFEKKEGKRLFANPQTFGQELHKLKESLQEESTLIQAKLTEIEKTQNGEPYDKNILKGDFNLKLTDNTLINQLKTAIVLFLKKNKNIELLEERNKEGIESLNSLNEKLQLKKGKDKNELLIEFKEQRKNIEKEWEDNKDLLSIAEKHLALNNQEFSTQTDIYKLTNETYLKLDKKLKEIKKNFERKFPDVDSNFIQTEVFEVIKYDELNRNLEEAKKGYHNEYIEVVSAFDETQNKADVNINLQIKSDTFDFFILESTLLGTRIKHLDNIKPEMDKMNRTRLEFVDDLYEKMIKIFSKTEEQYKKFDSKVKDLNEFFKNKKISEQYYFSINFLTEKCLDINWIYSLREKSSEVFMKGEIPFGESTDDFIEKFFKRIAKHREKVSLPDLLNPKSYFHLSTKMVDENGVENSGSTGETYTALVLLGIARLSLVQNKDRGGLRFIILEESSNLDDTNFNLFPKIAKDYHYQIITMTPKPFGSDSAEGWYLHQLIKGKENKDLNYPIPASYFKTKNARKKLITYIKDKNL